MEDHSPEIDALREAIHLNRENLLNDLLLYLGFDNIDEPRFQEMLQLIEDAEKKSVKLNEALSAQEVINNVLKNKNL